METQLFNKENMPEAGALLRKGELVAFPTETVYGLGAIASDNAAVKKVYQVKGRPSDNPLIVHVASHEIGQYVAEIPNVAKKMMEVFWPGPLTLIFNAKPGVFAPAVTGGQSTVALRMPAQDLSLRLIQEAGFPLVGPSANTSGKPSPTTAQHVLHDLGGKIAGVVEGGETQIGVESTVLDLTDERGLIILRPGAVTKEQLQIVTDQKVWMNDEVKVLNPEEAPKAPGMKYTHYSPNQPVILMRADWSIKISELLAEEKVIGVLASDEQIAEIEIKDEIIPYSLGSRTDARIASQRLYAGLRYFDNQDVDVILAEAYPKDGIGIAFMNRLEKASSAVYPQ
ncbi:L-threonylcarbamoyladenylate synthase [Jeotgalibaca sp. A127]|uniref:L-threonylcarbamoyladenylate synthase n=1 Tax=Jeotgalibaca sp. A127 TaxID=3457324 RepID=UPI003FD3C659